MLKVVWYCKWFFLVFNFVFLHKETHNLLCVDELYFSVMISHNTKVEWSILKQLDLRFFTSKTIKKRTLKFLLDRTMNSKFNLQLVNGKSAKCLNLLRKSMCWWYKNSRFPPLSKFPNWLMDWLYLVDGFAVLATAIFFGNCYCCKLKIK